MTGLQFEKLRVKFGYSRAQLAPKLGISDKTLQRTEEDTRSEVPELYLVLFEKLVGSVFFKKAIDELAETERGSGDFDEVCRSSYEGILLHFSTGRISHHTITNNKLQKRYYPRIRGTSFMDKDCENGFLTPQAALAKAKRMQEDFKNLLKDQNESKTEVANSK